MYSGALNNPNAFFDRNGHSSREAEFNVTKSQRLETVVTPSTRTIDTITDSATIFFFWNITHRINYTYNTIQALDDTSISQIQDADFKKFMDGNRGHYKWAIDFREDNRLLTKTENSWSNFRDWFMGTQKVTTKCHEAKSVTATRFVFENQDGTAELNAIMNPVDISEAVTTNPQVYTTVTFTIGNEETTKKFWIIVGVIAGLAGIAGIIFLIIKLKQWGIIRKKVPSNQSNNQTQSKAYYKPKKQKHKKVKNYKNRR